MKVLLVHNFYGSGAPSGENKVYEMERALLRSKGDEVAQFVRYSDDIRGKGIWGLIQGGLAVPWNPWMAAAIRRKINEYQPDVVHIHNTFPLLSPAIFSAIGTRAARVLTLHNYRLLCSAAIPMRRGGILCTKCIDSRSALPAIWHACYRNSRLATLPLAMNVALHRQLGTWTKKVDAFIVLTQFQRGQMVKGGLPADKIHVKPNFYPGKPTPLLWAQREDIVVFAGRLSAEKGVATLIRAWLMWGDAAPELRIIGEGPLRRELEQLAAGGRITFMGLHSSFDVQVQMAKAKLVILPSEWFETFGMTICEAFAFGTAAAVSNIGPLPSIVQDGVSGVVFEACDPDSLLRAVRAAWETPGRLAELSRGARKAFEQNYTSEVNYDSLMNIYQAALQNGRERALV